MPAFCNDPLWVDVSNSSTFPNLTQCFQHTILSYIPFGFLILLFPLLKGQGERMRYRFAPLPWTILIIIRMMISLYLCLNSLFVFAMNTFVLDDTYTVDVIYPLVWAGFFALNVIIDWNRRRVGQVSSGIQHIAFLIMTICTLPEFHYRLGHQEPAVLFAAYMTFWPLLLFQCLLYFWADKRYINEKTEKSDELDSSFMNRLTLWWFNSLPLIGAKRDLEMDDLFELNHGSSSEHLSALFEKYWIPAMKEYHERKMTLIKSGEKSEPPAPSIVHALFCMFKFEFLTASVIKFMSDTMQFANPFLLNQLIGFISDPKAPFWIGLSYAILMFVASELRSMLINAYFFIMIRMGIKIQTALTSAIYKKTMRLSSSSRREKTVGEIINLMSIDADFFQMITQQIQQFWSCPYQITFCLVYLFFNLGISAFPGVIVMILFIPLNIGVSIVIKRWQMQQMKLKDERTKMVNEVLNGIKVIKLYAWEVPMEEHINSIRNKELALIKQSAMVKNLLDTFNSASPFLVAASSFGTFILSSDDNILTPQIAFVSLTLFNQLRSPMSMIAVLINMMVQAVVANRRLKSFLVCEELEDKVIRSSDASVSNNSVEFRNVTASWDAHDESKPTILDVDIVVPRGSFVSVVGTVGSGKSSLISAMLGELTIVRGEIIMTGSVAYVPQQSWIQNLSVRDNITFGKPFDREFYEKVIFACALKPDFAILPHGDMTEIGEKGINLSGGQKARISLARAVYQQDDVYLLDDPLSAVDAHVGRHIFNHVLGRDGLLGDKTRVLITHGLKYARDAEDILVMKDGSIIERGKFDHLLKMDGVFARLIDEYTRSTSDEEEIEGDEELDELAANEKEDSTKQDASVKSPEKKVVTSDVDKKLIQKEGIESGWVKLNVYMDYIRAASKIYFFSFLIALIGLQVFQMLRSFWLSAWSNENDPAYTGEMMDQYARLGVYCGIGTIESLSYLVSLFCLVFAGLNASQHLHSPLIHNVLRSPISFFDTTPLGRILNRCSKDISTIDAQLPMNFRAFIFCILQVICTVVVILIATPLFIVVIVPLTIIYILFLRFYVPTSRQLKRLESVNRSPVISHFGESIQGAASIRAYRKVGEFCLSSEEKVDTFIRCKYLNVVSNRWLAVRLEFIGNCIIFFSALFAILSKEWGWTSSAGVVGVSVSYAMSITDVLNYVVRIVSELESNIVSVERVKEYSEMATEAEWEIDEKCPPASWPSQGVVRFENYSTRYRPGLDLVLKGINAEIGKGEKIGIVGRTGAGKSSFALALFRMIESASGVIRIDSIDTAHMGLHHLRKKLTIIPQDPVLFSGTLRFNLDPFGEYDDAALWTALRLAHLETFTRTLASGLDHVISEGGENISVGQRQLVCLARATLRNSKILVLDEATAAVDLQTDSLIQGTIRNHFKDCTVFTIAHRLNTILDYDRIMVLDQGQIAEMDTPAALMANKDSIFSRMLADAEADSK